MSDFVGASQDFFPLKILFPNIIELFNINLEHINHSKGSFLLKMESTGVGMRRGVCSLPFYSLLVFSFHRMH